jgi:hypothetical protein
MQHLWILLVDLQLSYSKARRPQIVYSAIAMLPIEIARSPEQVTLSAALACFNR